MDILNTIFAIIILIISVMFHELAHGVTADKLGDPTPSLAGRLTLNPIKHLDLVGSFILPLLCVLIGGGFIIGWAKPIPFNPKYFKSPRWGSALVAAAGPIMNIVVALLAAIAFRFLSPIPTMASFASLLSLVVIINISLAIFNLIPILPLDGHHILGALFPVYKKFADRAMQSYGFILLIVVIFAAGSFIGPVIEFFARLFLGV